jgi:hypothetical protein
MIQIRKSNFCRSVGNASPWAAKNRVGVRMSRMGRFEGVEASLLTTTYSQEKPFLIAVPNI